jgi:MPBQ/MSBQ methyltransferase
MPEHRMVNSGNETIIQAYDRAMLKNETAYYYENSDFYNYGYWDESVSTQRAACEKLMEKLLSFIPFKQGNILDVACGLGATTRHLVKYYPAERVVAINISNSQLARARINAPGCKFLFMDATRLEFGDASFDNIICVEAAFHFNTRDKFLREVYRVLRPGGGLVMCDIMFHRISPFAARHFHIPAANYLDTPDAYRQRLAEIGFADAEVIDATQACWGGFYHHLEHWAREEWQAGKLGLWNYFRASISLWFTRVCLRRGVRYYLLISARKG